MAGAPPFLLDSHIHLWPSTSTSPSHHGWMTPGHPLARRHGITDYAAAIRTSSPSAEPTGFVYVETDRYLPSVSPSFSHDEIQAAITGDIQAKQRLRTALEEWASEPLDELRFLTRIAQGTGNVDVDGFTAPDGDALLALVVWAPVHLPPFLFQLYLEIAASVAGIETWRRVAGFRYLIQGIKEETEMRKLVEHPDWLDNLVGLSRGRGGKGWSFDIGVDSRSGGVWQVEVAADMVVRIRELEKVHGEGTVRFVLNHLCKPDMATVDSPTIPRWTSALERLSAAPSVYMKFSGCFSEFGEKAPSSIDEIIERISYYAGKTFELFGPKRVMYGSDWPVCNVGGPTGELSWGVWREVVERWLKREMQLSADGQERVWWGTAVEAYVIERESTYIYS